MAAPVSSSNDQPDPLTPREPDPTITGRPATAQNAPQPSPAAVPELIPAVPLDAAAVTGWITALAFMDHAVGDAELNNRISALEDLKAAAAAAQARATVALRRLPTHAPRPPPGYPPTRSAKASAPRSPWPGGNPRARGRPLARHCQSPGHRNATHPRRPEHGKLNEWRATILVRETACLTLEDRHAVDAELAADTGALDGYRRPPDPPWPAHRRTGWTRLSPRPRPQSRIGPAGQLPPRPGHHDLPDRILPVAAGVAVYAALTRHADALKAAGDPRSRPAHGRQPRRTRHRQPRRPQQHRNPTHHDRPHPAPRRQRTRRPARLRHRPRPPPATSSPHPPTNPGKPPAKAASHAAGPRPEPCAGRPGTRKSGSGSAGSTPPPAPETSSAWTPNDGSCPTGLRGLITTRDDTCRTPYCDAPIRHADHIIPWRTTRTHQRRRHPRPLRSLQPNQRNPRLDRPTHPRPTPHHRNPHPHRPHLHLHRPTPARHPPHRNNASAYDAGQISAGGGDDERRQDDRHPKRHNGSLPLHTNSHRCEDQGHPAVQAAPNRFNASKAH